MTRLFPIFAAFALFFSLNAQAMWNYSGAYKLTDAKTGRELGEMRLGPVVIDGEFRLQADLGKITEGPASCWGDYEPISGILSLSLHCGYWIKGVTIKFVNDREEGDLDDGLVAVFESGTSKARVFMKRISKDFRDAGSSSRKR
jgi:hypothetical protein